MHVVARYGDIGGIIDLDAELRAGNRIDIVNQTVHFAIDHGDMRAGGDANHAAAAVGGRSHMHPVKLDVTRIADADRIEIRPQRGRRFDRHIVGEIPVNRHAAIITIGKHNDIPGLGRGKRGGKLAGVGYVNYRHILWLFSSQTGSVPAFRQAERIRDRWGERLPLKKIRGSASSLRMLGQVHWILRPHYDSLKNLRNRKDLHAAEDF